MGRRKACSLDSLERREVFSITPMLGLLAPKLVATTSLSGVTTTPITSFDGGSGITQDMSPPRPNEAARRAFKASFSGRVLELPPRLYDQSHQFYILAPGGTNQFLHGTLQMRYYTPTSSATSNFSAGSFSISDRSTASGGVILADLSTVPAQFDSRGRPTQLSFTVNGGGGSGGIYASSVGNGTVAIKYHGNRAQVVVVGSIFIQGIGQNLDVFQSNTHR